MTALTQAGTATDRRWEVTLSDHPGALAVQPGGGLVAAGSLGGETVVLDPADGAVLATLPAHEFGVLALAWSPDGERLAVGGQDGRVALYDVDGSCLADVAVGGWVAALAWSADGRWLAAGSNREVHVLDRDGAAQRHYPGQPSTVTALAWAGSRQRLGVACYGGVRWFEPAAGGEEPVKVFDWKGSLLVLEVSPDQRWVASGNQDSSIHVWKLWSAEDLEMTGFPSKVATLTWDASSRFLASGGANDVTVWDHSGRGPQGRRPGVLAAHDKLVTALAYQRRGGLLASGARDGLAALWRPADGFERRGGAARRTLTPLALLRDGEPVVALAWTVDDRDLLVARADGTVASWGVTPP